VIITYEPMWTIGVNGIVATPQKALYIHQ